MRVNSLGLEKVSTGTNVTSVSKPSGIYADNFHVYWANKRFTSEEGSLVKASEFPKVMNDPAAVSIIRSALSYQAVVKSSGGRPRFGPPY